MPDMCYMISTFDLEQHVTLLVARAILSFFAETTLE